MMMPIALPSEILEPIVTSALNLALTRLVEEGDPTDEAVSRFVARVEGVHYIVICNSCNNPSYKDSNGVHASMAMQNFMRITEDFQRDTIENRRKTIAAMREARTRR